MAADNKVSKKWWLSSLLSKNYPSLDMPVK